MPLDVGGVPWVVADGRNFSFYDHSFDIVYSNSIIEHLRTLENHKLFAKECQ
ncbi:class I SAM-dependent methyltransferase [Chloroflexus sp.]|uniref:class I SAM-dependent methyltransferase n=1 Tax=Chloroflexus sp. TaxID=1904827 RepID=UPI003D0B3745